MVVAIGVDRAAGAAVRIQEAAVGVGERLAAMQAVRLPLPGDDEYTDECWSGEEQHPEWEAAPGIPVDLDVVVGAGFDSIEDGLAGEAKAGVEGIRAELVDLLAI